MYDDDDEPAPLTQAEMTAILSEAKIDEREYDEWQARVVLARLVRPEPEPV